MCTRNGYPTGYPTVHPSIFCIKKASKSIKGNEGDKTSKNATKPHS